MINTLLRVCVGLFGPHWTSDAVSLRKDPAYVGYVRCSMFFEVRVVYSTSYSFANSKKSSNFRRRKTAMNFKNHASQNKSDFPILTKQ